MVGYTGSIALERRNVTAKGFLYNEINSGFYRNTAGTKTITTYRDLYQKSMRLVYLIARQYDPHAKPFISLDHCWTKIPDVRSYAARDLLNLWVDFSHEDRNMGKIQ